MIAVALIGASVRHPAAAARLLSATAALYERTAKSMAPWPLAAVRSNTVSQPFNNCKPSIDRLLIGTLIACEIALAPVARFSKGRLRRHFPRRHFAR